MRNSKLSINKTLVAIKQILAAALQSFKSLNKIPRNVSKWFPLHLSTDFLTFQIRGFSSTEDILWFRSGDADTNLITAIPQKDLLIWMFVLLNPGLLFILLHRYIHSYKMPLAGITCHHILYEVFSTFLCFEEGWSQRSSLSLEVSPSTILQQNHLGANTQTDVLCSSEQADLFNTSKI